MIWYWDFVEYGNHSIFKFFKCFRLYWYGGKYHSNKSSWHTRLYIVCTDNGLDHALLTFTWWNMFVTIKYLDVFIIWVDVFMRYRALKNLKIFVNFLIIFTGKNQQFFSLSTLLPVVTHWTLGLHVEICEPSFEIIHIRSVNASIDWSQWRLQIL